MRETREKNNLEIQICHTLPGRMRLSLSHAPGSMEALQTAVCLHPGILTLAFTPVTGSLLIRFDPQEIDMSEVILRLAVYLCRERKLDRAVLSFANEHDDIGFGGYFSASLLLAAALWSRLPSAPGLKRTLRLAATLSTAGAVVGHGVKEVRDHGMFDPEVLSLVYLLVSLMKGGGLKAAAITWGTTYGRHLISPEPETLAITVKPKDTEEAMQVSVSRQTNQLALLFRLIPALSFDLLTGARIGKDTLLEKMKQVSRSHEDLLEGLTRLEKGFNLSIE